MNSVELCVPNFTILLMGLRNVSSNPPNCLIYSHPSSVYIPIHTDGCDFLTKFMDLYFQLLPGHLYMGSFNL